MSDLIIIFGKVLKGIVASPTPPTPPSGGDALLLETGDYILLESGDKILLE